MKVFLFQLLWAVAAAAPQDLDPTHGLRHVAPGERQDSEAVEDKVPALEKIEVAGLRFDSDRDEDGPSDRRRELEGSGSQDPVNTPPEVNVPPVIGFAEGDIGTFRDFNGNEENVTLDGSTAAEWGLHVNSVNASDGCGSELTWQTEENETISTRAGCISGYVYSTGPTCIVNLNCGKGRKVTSYSYDCVRGNQESCWVSSGGRYMGCYGSQLYISYPPLGVLYATCCPK